MAPEPPADATPRLTATAVAVVAAGASFSLLPLAEAALAAAFAGLAVTAAASDLARFEIPDWASALIFALGLVHAAAFAPADGFAAGGLGALLGMAGTSLAAFGGAIGDGLASVVDALARAAVAGGALWAVAAGYRRLRGVDGLGFGDVKLAAALGPWLAWTDLPTALLVAVLAALAAVAVRTVRARDLAAANVPVPLGAFLAPAGFLVFLARAAGFPLPFFGG